VYTLGHALDQPGLLPFDAIWPDMVQSLRADKGWWAEHDWHQTSAKQDQMLTWLCGPTQVRSFGGDSSLNYTRDIFAVRQSYMQIELRRLAHLTARHHAKLIVLFQPYPCAAAPGEDFIPAREADIAAVATEYPNVVAPDPVLFEHWPGKWFTGPDHLRTGYEDAASRRVGRTIATALGLPIVEPPEPPVPSAAVPVWSSTDVAAPPWRQEGLVLTPHADGSGIVISETTSAGWHRIETNLPDLPAKTYVFSTTFRADGTRQIQLEMRDAQLPGAYGTVRCSAADGDSSRYGAMIDSGIEGLPGNVFRCWGKLTLTKIGAVIAIDLSRSGREAGPYQGDGRSGVVLYNVDISAVDTNRL
jgi:hypothetical protein